MRAGGENGSPPARVTSRFGVEPIGKVENPH
jgi:hypothetical protein